MHNTDDLRIKEIRELSPPEDIRKEFPLTERATQVTYETRRAVHRVLHGADDRLLIIVGPCSIHDPKAALEYATRLKPNRIVMPTTCFWSCAFILRSREQQLDGKA
jgi:3-deoxy-7-phosphoheptulonate synthase